VEVLFSTKNVSYSICINTIVRSYIFTILFIYFLFFRHRAIYSFSW